MRIVIASDVAGDQIRERVVQKMVADGHAVNVVASGESGDDRGNYGEQVVLAVLRHDAERGIIISSRSVGAAIAANRTQGIRAALCGDADSAYAGARDEGMNVLVLGLHLLQENSAEQIVEAYLRAPLAPVEVVGGLLPMRLQRVFSHISDNLDKELSVADLATVVGMSQYYFSKLFKTSTGTTPHQYVLRQRIDRARDYLREPTPVLADIATKVGFQTQSHFGAVFHRLVGLTPRQYRKLHQVDTSAVADLERHDDAAGEQKSATAA